MNLLPVLVALIAAVPAAAAPAAAASAAPSADRCTGGSVDLARNVDVVEAWRGFKGADGQSHVERITIPGTRGVYYGGAVRLTKFDLGTPSAASLVYGVPDMVIPAHPVPYREIFIILSGSSELQFPDGTVQALKPGSMFIAEDLDTPGRGGRVGPCGYVALALAYTPAAPATTPAAGGD